ncbi:MAG: hypothetical protein PHW03_04645 [Eubacteriales bacterium]|nr:hypothetical protein [Eubacteriales bacterium]MDD4390071.1 hypothetical protein [Eubacteriales bacterium]
MLRKKFGAILTALIVTVAMPAAAFAGTSFAEVTLNDGLFTVTQGIPAAPAPEDGLQPQDAEGPQTEQPAEGGQPDEGQPTGEQPPEGGQPDEGQQPADDLEGEDPGQPADGLEPQVPGQPSVDEGEPGEEQPVDEQLPVAGEQPGESEAPAVEPEEGILPEAPPVPEEEIVPEEEMLPEELLEEEIIVEPIAATLTIVQRLIIDGEIDDFIQVIDGLEVGQIVNVSDYIVVKENIVYTSDVTEITLSGENSEVILEYALAKAYEFENLEK